MTEGEQDFVFTDNLKVLQRVMGVLFNNAQLSDTTFIVKEKKFYALSQLVSASSPSLNSVISSHIEHCTDKEIKIYDVKNAESFSVILKYMYGLEINFSQMDKVILCEVLSLSETYTLPEFTAALKEYVSKIETFTIDTLAVLLNTAKTFDMVELYEKLCIFAYCNAEEFVCHDSIKHVQYDVFVDLLKSDWLYAEEIKILRAVLNWHSDMYSKKDRSNSETILVKQSESEEQDVSSDIQLDDSEYETADDSEFETDLDESIDSLCLDENDSHMVFPQTEKLDSEANVELPGIGSNQNHGDANIVTSNQTERHLEVIESFSENVLKSLLSLIRFKQISMCDVFGAARTKLFKKYLTILAINEHFSQISEPRMKYDEMKLETFSDIKTKFSIDYSFIYDIRIKSQDQSLPGDLKWNICMKRVACNSDPNNYYLEMYLQCTSDKQSDWECKAECQLTLISHKSRYLNITLPEHSGYTSVVFTPSESLVILGKYYRDSRDWCDAYCPGVINAKYHFELKLKSVQIKKKNCLK